MTTANSEKPRNGYLTDYQYNGVWRKGIKFPEGKLSYYDQYSMILLLKVLPGSHLNRLTAKI